jgi:ribosomal protein L11 methyltransferase
MDTAVWMEGWKESFRPICTGKFFVYPPWEAVPADARELIPIVIEPGMAFGTGQHATTQLSLQGIEAAFAEAVPRTVADVGTGTGILAIAVAKLGCQTIDASDIDPDAILAARQNFSDNRVTSAAAYLGTVVPPDLRKPLCRSGYDLVVANILPVVLREIIVDLCEAVAEHGRLLMSGFLNEQEGELINLVKRRGFQPQKVMQVDGWSMIIFSRFNR